MTHPTQAPQTWVLLRGLMRESRHWGSFPDLLQAPWPGCKVVTLDLPGNGQFNTLASPLSVPDMAEFCRTEIKRLGVVQPCGLLAMSLGAMVATAWASGHPSEVAACVLINTSMRPYSPFYRRLRPGNYPTLLKLAAFGGTPVEWETAVMKLTTHQVQDRAATLADWLRIRADRPVSQENALRQLLAAARYEAPATTPQAPTLVLTSTHDSLVDTRCSQGLAAAWQADLVAHPTAGHDLPLDDGPWVVDQVRRWLG